MLPFNHGASNIQKSSAQTGQELVAGFNAGKKVYATPEAFAVIRELRIASADKQNYYATLIISGIRSLASGADKKNTFLNPKQMNGGDETFHMFFPGAKLTIQRTPNDNYCINKIEVSAALADTKEYQDLYTKGHLPGLFKCDIEDNVTKVSASAISECQRVIVADISEEQPWKAAREVKMRMVNCSQIDRTFFKSDFVFHFTPGDKRLDGLSRYLNAKRGTISPLVRQSAFSLVNTMKVTNSINGISWISELSGSDVLLESASIAAKTGLKVENHDVFMYQPTASMNQMAQFASIMGLQYGRKLGQSGAFDYQPLDQAKLAAYRLKHEESTYKFTHGLVDGGAPLFVMAAATTTAIGATAALTGGMAILPSVLGVTTAIGGGATALKLCKDTASLLPNKRLVNRVGAAL